MRLDQEFWLVEICKDGVLRTAFPVSSLEVEELIDNRPLERG